MLLYERIFMRASKVVREIEALMEKHGDVRVIGYNSYAAPKTGDMEITNIEDNTDDATPVILIDFS